jgi:hypothetical protein
MDMHPGRSFHRPRTVTLALGVALVAAVLGLSQCRLADQPITGVDTRENTTFGDKHSKCEHQCNNAYKSCKRAEHKRHEAAEKACDGLKDRGERKSCRRAEEDRHDKEIDACKAAKKQCKRDCNYREGSGKGGR